MCHKKEDAELADWKIVEDVFWVFGPRIAVDMR